MLSIQSYSEKPQEEHKGHPSFPHPLNQRHRNAPVPPPPDRQAKSRYHTASSTSPRRLCFSLSSLSALAASAAANGRRSKKLLPVQGVDGWGVHYGCNEVDAQWIRGQRWCRPGATALADRHASHLDAFGRRERVWLLPQNKRRIWYLEMAS